MSTKATITPNGQKVAPRNNSNKRKLRSPNNSITRSRRRFCRVTTSVFNNNNNNNNSGHVIVDSSNAITSDEGRAGHRTVNAILMSPSTSGANAGGRKLSDDDVRSIFSTLHDNSPIPDRLVFQIIFQKGTKVSPPALEYENGLYVLLQQSQQKKTRRAKTRNSNSSGRKATGSDKSGASLGTEPAPKMDLPPHLERFVMKDLPAEPCNWSLSGPQFPQPTAFQQRYCYPKGREQYSKNKGGALWTAYNADGETENMEYRILHVYHSIKRSDSSTNNNAIACDGSGAAKRVGGIQGEVDALVGADSSPNGARSVDIDGKRKDTKIAASQKHTLATRPQRKRESQNISSLITDQQMHRRQPTSPPTLEKACPLGEAGMKPARQLWSSPAEESSTEESGFFVTPTMNDLSSTSQVSSQNAVRYTSSYSIQGNDDYVGVWQEEKFDSGYGYDFTGRVKSPLRRSQRAVTDLSSPLTQRSTGSHCHLEEVNTSITVDTDPSPWMEELFFGSTPEKQHEGTEGSTLGETFDDQLLMGFDLLKNPNSGVEVDARSISTGVQNNPTKSNEPNSPRSFEQSGGGQHSVPNENHEDDLLWIEPNLLTTKADKADGAAAPYSHEGRRPVSPSSFRSGLLALQKSLRMSVLDAGAADQPTMVASLAAWARQVACDPLGTGEDGMIGSGAEKKKSGR